MHDANKLETLIARLPRFTAPPGWRNDVMAAIDAGTPPAAITPRRCGMSPWLRAGQLGVAVAAALAIYVITDAEPRTPRVADGGPLITVAPYRNDRSRRSAMRTGDGDEVVIRARGARELRVYRAGARMARCPGDTGCAYHADGPSLKLPVTLDDALFIVAYAVPLPPPPSESIPSLGDLDADLHLATSLRIRTRMSSLIDTQ